MNYQTIDIFNIIAIISDSVALIVVAMLVYGAMFESKEEHQKRKFFLLVCLIVLITLVTDIFGYSLPYAFKNEMFFKILDLFTIMISGFITTPFVYYEVALIRQKKANARTHLALVNLVSTSIIAVLEIILTINGTLFSLDANCNFLYGDTYWVVYVGFAFSFFCILMAAILHIKTLGWHDTTAIFMYLFFPIIGMILEVCIDGLSISYSLVAISIVLIYIMLQSRHINELALRESILKEETYKDSLTGVSNRRAYNKLLDSAEKNKRFGVIYCDLNKLKYTNDHYGHEAGDKLLVDFAKLCKKQFLVNDIYRVSGDEFIMIDTQSDVNTFDKKAIKFSHELFLEGEIASFGYAYGSGKMALSLIKEAETMMYKNKKLFHEKYPELER